MIGGDYAVRWQDLNLTLSIVTETKQTSTQKSRRLIEGSQRVTGKITGTKAFSAAPALRFFAGGLA
jgi:hypothetical protein